MRNAFALTHFVIPSACCLSLIHIYGVADDYTTAMAVTDTAIHEIDVLPWLVNDEWDEVQCIMPKTNSKVKNALKDPQIMIMKTKGCLLYTSRCV